MYARKGNTNTVDTIAIAQAGGEIGPQHDAAVITAFAGSEKKREAMIQACKRHGIGVPIAMMIGRRMAREDRILDRQIEHVKKVEATQKKIIEFKNNRSQELGRLA
jgi:hypothetical protein